MEQLLSPLFESASGRKTDRISKQITRFLSGSSTDAIIDAYTNTKQAIGVDIQTVRPRHMEKLGEYASTGGAVFVDSGAFGVRQRGGSVDFDKVFRLYWTLVSRSGEGFRNLSLVMPDVIGDQSRTLELLAEYKADIDELIQLGVRAIVPAQSGDLTLSELYEEYSRMFGDRVCLGIPCKMDATPKEEVLSFFRISLPRSVHLLGLGITDQNAPFLEQLLEAAPDCYLTVDSTWHRSLVGEGRPITEARRSFLAEFMQVEQADLSVWDPFDGVDSRAEANALAKIYGIEADSILEASEEGELSSLLEQNDPGFHLSYYAHRAIVDLRKGKEFTRQGTEYVVLDRLI